MIERKGSQLRIRLRNPNMFNKSSFRTKDVGNKGGLQLILGRLKGRTKTTIQALRVSRKDFVLRNKTLIPKTQRGIKEIKSIKKLVK